MRIKHSLATLLGVAILVFSASASAVMTETKYSTPYGGYTRAYLVNKPSSCTTNCPLVVDLHGFTSNKEDQKSVSGQLQKGDTNGYIVAYPDGLGNSWNSSNTTTYGACCGYASDNKIDDVGFIREMVSQIKINFPMVDPKRVYITGLSNGCAQAQRVAAEASDIFAAQACTSQYLLTNTTSLKRPMAVTEVHAFNDEIVSYNKFVYTGAQNNFKRWASLNGCTGTPTKQYLTLGSYVQTYNTCKGGVKVKLYSLANSGHVTYLNFDGIDVAQVIWDNLKGYRLP